MLDVLKNRTYRHLLAAQVIALLGTGLATIALSLLAYDLAGGNAGAVLGTALAIKMVAYILVAPIASGFTDRIPRRALLVSLDIIRALVALGLPFVTHVWQVYVLIFVLQSASAAFTPTFQATIPDVLPDEAQYTKALSLSRLAYDLENLISPALAAALLSVVSFHSLFFGTSIGFIASALLVISVAVPKITVKSVGGVYERTTKGIRLYFSTPRLKGLLALNLAIASASAMVIVNTVVLVQSKLGLTTKDVAWMLAAYGAGSMVTALLLPRILEKFKDRSVMFVGAGVLVVGLFLGPVMSIHQVTLMVLWACLGVGGSLVQTPSGRLLRRSANAADRPAIFAAQFALSHACWLISYPLAGWLGARSGMGVSFSALAFLAAVSVALAIWVWPKGDGESVVHEHPDLPRDHPHLAGGHVHSHEAVIDDLHAHWPNRSH